MARIFFRIAGFGIVAYFVAVAFAGENATEAEVKKLQGTWHLHRVWTAGGGDLTYGEPRGKLVLTQDKFEIWTGTLGKFKKSSEGKYRINPKADPKELDLEDMQNDKKRVRIFSYKLDGDKLTLGQNPASGRLKTWKLSELEEGSQGLEYERAKN